MIRAATPADVPSILAIWNPIIRDTIVTFSNIERTPDDLMQMMADKARNGHAFLVTEDAGHVTGFATYSQFRNGNGYARSMEHTIILDQQVHGIGVGRALMTAIETHARAGGAHLLYAGVSGGNVAGRAFHAAMGFGVAAVLSDAGWKFGRYHDLVLMQKFLS